jgi:hypothetical protein
MATAVPFHRGNRTLRNMEEPRDIDTKDSRIVSLGVFGEGLGDEDAGVIDERVDPSEPRHTHGNRIFGRFPVSDVPRYNENIGIARRLYRACCRHYAVPAIGIGCDKGCTDTLRCAGNHSNLLFSGHRECPW